MNHLKNMKKYEDMTSEELCSRYLNGDKNITLKDIEDKEHSEYFYNTLKKWSFGKSYLEPVVILPMFLYLLFKIEPFIFVMICFLSLNYLLK